MHSSSADCVFGDARLISSTSRRFAKTGPALNSNSFERWSKTLTPVTSDGSRSGVNCIRENVQSSDRASAFASIVFPTPGKSSMIRCPSLTRQRATSSSVSRSAWTTRATLSTTCAIVRAAASLPRVLGLASIQQFHRLVEDCGRDSRFRRLRDVPLACPRDQRHLVVLRVEPDVGSGHVVVDDEIHVLVREHPPLPFQPRLALLRAERDDDLAVRAPRRE